MPRAAVMFNDLTFAVGFCGSLNAASSPESHVDALGETSVSVWHCDK